MSEIHGKDRPPGQTISLAEAARIYLQNLRRNPQTIQTYAALFRRYLFTYCPPDMAASGLTAEQLAAFPGWLVEQQVADWDGDELHEISKATRDLTLAAVKGFILYLLRQKLLILPPADFEQIMYEFSELRRQQALEKKLPPTPTQPAIQMIIETAKAEPPPAPEARDAQRLRLIQLRDIAILELLRATGLRVGELVALKRRHLDFERRQVLVERTKSKEPRIVPLEYEPALEAVRVYLEARQDSTTGRGRSELPLFARHDRKAGGRVLKPLGVRTAQNLMAKYAQLAGQDGITPHSLRHAFAQRLYDSTRRIDLVQRALGHQNISTTQIYAKTQVQDIRAALRQVSGQSKQDPEL